MQVTVKRLPKSRVELTIEVPAERMADFFAAAYQDLANQVEIPGFRKGKAPKTMVKEQLGVNRVISAAVELALPRTYHEAVMQEKLVPVAEPAIHVDKVTEDGPFVYRAEVDVVPDVDPGKYQAVRVDAKKYAAKTVEQKDLDESLDRLKKAAATPKPVLRGAQKGDWIEIGYTGKVAGVVQEGLQNQHHPLLLGDNTLVPGFEEQLFGMTKGETKAFSITINKQLVEFSVTLNEVSELELPDVDDALAKKFGKKSAEELTTALKDQLQADRDREARQGLEAAVVQAVVKQSTVELPEVLIHREVERRIETLTEQLRSGGQDFSSWLKSQKKDPAAFRKELEPAAEESVKAGLVLREIADREGFIKPGEPASEEALTKTVNYLVEQATK